MHNTEGVIILDSPYATQLDRGFRRLRFDVPNLEQEYRAECAESHLPRMRAGFILAAGLYLVFLLVRVFTESGPAATIGLLLRTTIILTMLLTVVVSYYTPWRRIMPLLILFTYLVFAGGITAIEVVGHYFKIDRHYEGLIFLTIHAYVFSGLVFRQAFFTGLLIFVIYLIGGWLGGLTGMVWAYELLFIALLNLLGAVALYQLERAERDNFLRRNLLKEMAGRDGLTGIHNRSAFLEHFGRVLKQAGREQGTLGLLILDLDYFKQYNDRYGHLEGDAILRRVAQAVSAEFRRPLDFFARYGGEEFVGLWYGLDREALDRLVRTVRDAVAALQIPHESSPFQKVTGTIGAVVFQPKGDESTLGLIKEADTALYEAKDSGRNAVVIRNLAAGESEAALQKSA